MLQITVTIYMKWKTHTCWAHSNTVTTA